MTKSDKELMLQAIEGLEPGDIFGSKYGSALEFPSKESSSLHSTSRTLDEADGKDGGRFDRGGGSGHRHHGVHLKGSPAYPGTESPQPVEIPVDSADFAHMMRHELQKIKRYHNDKYYEQVPSRSVEDIEMDPLTRTLVTEPLPTDPQGLREVVLMKNQAALLQRFARADECDCSEIALRQLRKDQAMRELKEEVEYMYRKGLRFLRVITGKGHGSKGNPVIKLETIQWLEQEAYEMVLGYAPELCASGDYGVIVVEIKRRPEF